ncbi:uncharacterized protein LOC116291245 [Actinia tenebrosa]|uniref:Uncharacterized protein LOC116291245 n=1 Tax=Actinia tenebrosa TaxID=6105 RepID=A0A6P8HET8_ACTTE|nr:uncharacterized protein LOC116291245 [Actinia tenebrosa]
MNSSSITLTLLAIALLFIIRGAVSAVSSSTQSGCYNSQVTLTCPHYTQNRAGNLKWRFYNKATSKWSLVASITGIGNMRVNSANTPLDGRLTIHPSGSLEIATLKPDDETEFMCIVTQGPRKLHRVFLNVTCGNTTLITRQICLEEDVVLDCDAKHRTNPRKLDEVKWHKKNTSGNDVSWSLLVASRGSNPVVANGLQFHGNGSLVLKGGRAEGVLRYKCDVTKNVASQLDRHIIVLKNIKCQQPVTPKTRKGRSISSLFSL